MRKPILLLALGVVSLALAGCAALPPALSGVAAAVTIADKASTVINTGSAVLSDAATLACAGQKAANDAGAAASMLGQAKAATDASAVSMTLGQACSWKL